MVWNSSEMMKIFEKKNGEPIGLPFSISKSIFLFVFKHNFNIR